MKKEKELNMSFTIDFKKNKGSSTDWQENYNKALGEAILLALKKNNLSQKELAKEIGVAPSTVNQWTRGNNTIPSNYLLLIQDTLKIDLLYYASYKAGVNTYDANIDMPLTDLNDDIRNLKEKIKNLFNYFSDSDNTHDLTLINDMLDLVSKYLSDNVNLSKNKKEQDQ